MEINKHFHAPAILLARKETSQPIGCEAKWDPEPVYRCGIEEKNPHPFRESNPGRPACR
jgi:hypothetical protein